MITARQALANSTYFHGEGLYWNQKANEARRAGDTKGEALARWRLAKVTRQLKTIRRLAFLDYLPWRWRDEN